MARARSPLHESIKIAFLLFIVFFEFIPFFIMFVVSFKTNEQYLNNPWWFDPISEWNWQNWAVGWDNVSGYIWNSIFVSVTGTTVTACIVLMCAYALARYRFPGRSIIYYGVMATMFLPGTAATLVTVFDLLRNFGMINSLWALILMAAVGGQVVGVFILKQFIEDIPKELFESAEIDGAGHIQQIINIVIPMSGSIIAVLFIMDFISSWNNTILPLLLLRDDELLTIPVGLFRLDGQYVKQYGPLMAAYTISSIPLVLIFVFSMRFFVKAIAAGSVKS